MKITNKDICDCCGKRNTTIQRRYKSEGYCPNCYKTWFVKKHCHKCGEHHRFHKKEDTNICRECVRKQPCIRCGNDALKDGANTEYGRVCNICYAGYFKDKKQCFECGEFKRNVSRYSILNHNQKVCTSCYQKHFNETCSLCKRYRILIDTKDGRICKKCHEQGYVQCNNCNQMMPAGVGTRCWDCYWSERLIQEVKINSYLFSSEAIKRDYLEFTEWLSNTKGSKTAKLKNNNFIKFFIRCDELWGKIPSYKSLVCEFKPEGLRHNLTVLRWLISSKRVVEDLQTKAYIAEQERIVKLLCKFDTGLPKEVDHYYKFLMAKHSSKDLALITVRMSLQAVVGLYTNLNIKTGYTPTQEQIDMYLINKSGQRNSLTSFVRFLNREYNENLKCNRPKQEDITKASRRELESKIMHLATKSSPLSTKEKLLWYQVAIALFHDTNINLKTLKTITPRNLSDDMQILTYNKKEYCIPKPRGT